MDGSSTRRGARTAHLHHGDLHGTESWRGEARRFGEGVAILIGDLAHVYADQLLPPSPPEMLAVWDELRIELNVGQYLDLAVAAGLQVHLAELVAITNAAGDHRSEAHTSELQSPIRNTYAVCCLQTTRKYKAPITDKTQQR